MLLSGGADESYWLDELPDDDAAQQVLDAWQADASAQPVLWQGLLDHARTAPAVRQLHRMAALVPADALAAPTRVALVWLGDALAPLHAALAALPGLVLVGAGEPADLTVLIRSNAPWPEVLARYQKAPPTGLHMLVDVAHHHTLCLGPLVVPGDTACLACLGHRVAHRWGEAPLPPKPAAQDAWPLVAALLAQALHAGAGATTRLGWVEQATCLHLHTLASRREAVFRHPACPVCGPDALADDDNASGRLDLPWAGDHAAHDQGTA